ncbi:DUF2142 domain-containing protein [Prosthecochloris vibrioformis]|uniref:DUF2142 domain-containing protein n=1 Tax=Prosthecochloris vibrioformis TaxID=1098 RepID=A0A5C4S062_PROVB|nr:DUF2142 domain-containing protein [Prosthecochloris vibrioformis]TNJ36588.1 DUF2142 domain-containing protein [Prosthecochloris vibrioformis]
MVKMRQFDGFKLRISRYFDLQTSVVVALLLFACLILSSVIPPLKSPDEHDHIERAYLLGKGVFLLDQPEGKSSGGDIDSGLLEWQNRYLPSQDKLSAEMISSAKQIKWTGERIYNPSPGTGYYFPVIYLPQAAGLLIGELVGLTVENSYKLSRMLALVSIALLIYSAFRIYPVNPLVLAFIAMPMTLFQMSGAGLDGVSSAVAVFTVAAFMRISRDREMVSRWVQYAFSIAIAVLASSRAQTLPLLLLLVPTLFYKRDKKTLLVVVIPLISVIAWTLIALKTTVDLRVPIGESTVNVVSYYLLHPFQFFSILWNTLSNDNYLTFYYRSFLGILGWLDAPFERRYYTYFTVMILTVAVLSVSFNGVKKELFGRFLLVVVAMISVLFVYFALLVTWTPHPAEVISGVQGRYFLIPAIMLAYGIGGDYRLFFGLRGKLASLLVLCILLSSLTASVRLLLERYYLTLFEILPQEVVEYSDDDAQLLSEVLAGPALSESSSITIRMPLLDNQGFGRIRRIGVLFGTHMRENPGDAEIFFFTKSGESYRQKFRLSDLNDNAYKYFSVPPDYYVSGEVRYLTGGGISAWELHYPESQVITCLKLISVCNQSLIINGCP